VLEDRRAPGFKIARTGRARIPPSHMVQTERPTTTVRSIEPGADRRDIRKRSHEGADRTKGSCLRPQSRAGIDAPTVRAFAEPGRGSPLKLPGPQPEFTTYPLADRCQVVEPAFKERMSPKGASWLASDERVGGLGRGCSLDFVMETW